MQCSACHTRWFAHPAPAPAQLSEDEIITRLETRAARPRLAAEKQSSRPLGETLEPPPAPSGQGPGPEREAPALRAQATPEPRGAGEAPGRRTQAPAPILFPAADRPALGGEGDRDASPPLPATPLRPRQSERFETMAPPRPARAAPEPARPPARSGGLFAFGFLLALLLAGAALGAYLRPQEVTARIPTAVPTLDGYAAHVDTARAWIETRLGPLRDRLTAR